MRDEFIAINFLAADFAYQEEKAKDSDNLTAFLHALPYYRRIFSLSIADPTTLSYESEQVLLLGRVKEAANGDALLEQLLTGMFTGKFTLPLPQDSCLGKEEQQLLQSHLMRALDNSECTASRKHALRSVFKDDLQRTLSVESMLQIFDEIKKKDGHYAFMHKLKDPILNNFIITFLPKWIRHNEDDETPDGKVSHWWHTATYQYVVEQLQDRLVRALEKQENLLTLKPELALRISVLLKYKLGNTLTCRSYAEKYIPVFEQQQRDQASARALASAHANGPLTRILRVPPTAPSPASGPYQDIPLSPIPNRN